jgi:hypothetical protein
MGSNNRDEDLPKKPAGTISEEKKHQTVLKLILINDVAPGTMLRDKSSKILYAQSWNGAPYSSRLEFRCASTPSSIFANKYSTASAGALRFYLSKAKQRFRAV